MVLPVAVHLYLMAFAMVGRGNSRGNRTEGDRGNRKSKDNFFHGHMTHEWEEMHSITLLYYSACNDGSMSIGKSWCVRSN